MAFINESAELDIKCPQCGASFKKTIRQLKGPGVKCPSCGVSFETSNFKKGLDDTEQSLRDFARRIGTIKINVKL